jgi:hypothetical protein
VLFFGGEAYGVAENQSVAEPPHSCTSPFQESKPYADSATSDLQLYSGILATGVVARTTVPKGTYGVEAGFKHPHNNTPGSNEWRASNMVEPDKAGKVALKFAIGDEQVDFGVRFVAPEGSKVCKEKPTVSFEHKNIWEYPFAPGELPWNNWGNQLVNFPAQVGTSLGVNN